MVKNKLSFADPIPGPLSTVAKPEWLRVTDVLKLYALGRTTLYLLISEGKIKSACIKGRGNLRGLRVISSVSLDRYFNSVATGGEALETPTNFQAATP